MLVKHAKGGGFKQNQDLSATTLKIAESLNKSTADLKEITGHHLYTNQEKANENDQSKQLAI